MPVKTCRFLLAVIAINILLACGKPADGRKELLERAVSVCASQLAPMNLSRSAFYVAYPDGKPSDYVQFVFSTLGAAEWPPVEGGGEFSPEEQRGMQALNQLLPANIDFAPLRPDPGKTGLQVVFKADDGKGVVIFEGYASATDKPLLVVERPLVKVEPSMLARQAYQSMVEMGGSR